MCKLHEGSRPEVVFSRLWDKVLGVAIWVAIVGGVVGTGWVIAWVAGHSTVAPKSFFWGCS